MRIRGITVMMAVGLFALPALAAAASQLLATGVRIGDHPAYVRVVVDFNGKVPASRVEYNGLTPTSAWVSVRQRGAASKTAGSAGNGVRVTFVPGKGQALYVRSRFVRQRFKYVSYTVVGGNRLAIDLWKRASIVKAQTCRGLSLSSARAKSGVLFAAGSERDIFENQFQVVVRGKLGAVLARKTVQGPGAWNATVHYKAMRRQVGTVEAVASSPKDGSLACIAQRRVTLPAS
jgi:hypothetical protein